MRIVSLAVCIVLMIALAPQTAIACWSDNANLGRTGNLNADLNDIGMLFMDSHPSSLCGPVAASRLNQKLNAMSDSDFNGWLGGASVSLAFAAAMQLGPRGYITPDLDAALARVGRVYYVTLDALCGFNNYKWFPGDTCMDDHVVGAAAYAWIAAYYRKSARPWTGKKGSAVSEMRASLSTYDSICPHDPAVFDWASRGPCMTSPGPMVVTLNHNAQNPSYGIGSVTNLSVAFVGMDAIDGAFSAPSTFTAEQLGYLSQLWTEGQLHTNAGGTYLNNCYDDQASPWSEQQTTPCNDAHSTFHYQATMFPVWYTYNRYNLPIPSPQGAGYLFQTFAGTFNLTNRDEFFGAGRFAYYYILTKGYNDYGEQTWYRPSQFCAGPDYSMGLTTANGYWVTAEGNGGSDANANRTVQGPWESFYLHDNNGGTLMTGEAVWIRTTGNWYFSADQGGGAGLYVNRTTPSTWETFTIEKQGGNPWLPLNDGDFFALRTSNGHYVSAVAGGGAGMNATATLVGRDETFRFRHVADY